MEKNKNEKIDDYYFLLQQTQQTEENKNDKKLEEMLNDLDSVDDTKQLFVFDHKLNEERSKRLNEEDKLYKFKKHYFLRDSYKNIIDKERRKQYLEMEEEYNFQYQCKEAENKLRNKKPLNMFDLDNLIHRNHWIFSEPDRKRKKAINQYYYTMCFGSFLAFIMCWSFLNSSFIFLNINFKSKYSKLFANGCFSSLFLFSNLFLIRQSWNSKLINIISKYEKEILDPENEYLKMPKAMGEKDFNPFEKSGKDVYNF